MAIPDFFGQQQQSLRTGIQLGGAIRQAQDMERQQMLEAEEAPLRRQLLEQQVAMGEAQVANIPAAQRQADLALRAGEYQLQQQQQKDLDKGILQDAVLLSSFSFDREAQDALFPELINKYSEAMPELVPALNELYAMDDQQRTESLLQLIGGMSGQLTKDEPKTASIQDFEKWQDLQKTDPEGAKAFGRQAGFDRLTKEEEADLKVQTKGREEGAKGTAKRRQGFIDAGVEAADSMANLTRTIQLLDQVKTGGFDNVAFRAKQLFGIEGADEGELSANLGTAVLSQLKPIFGAAFTAAEGERLERISARFGASAETNKRLLEQTLKITERAARRGLKAAIDQGDDFTAAEIQDAINAIKEINVNVSPQRQELPQPVVPQQGMQQNRTEADILKQYGL